MMMIQTAAVLTLLFVAGLSAEQPQGDVSNVQPVASQSNNGVVSHSVVSVAAPQSVQAGPSGGQQVAVEHHNQQPQYYSPAGVIQVVSGEQQQPPQQVVGIKPQQVVSVRQYSAAEQYGQPESASIPPNYKPFGSWGLYIGGNPADGYYSNYYKALSSSVDKQQAGAEGAKPVSSQGVVSQASGFGPSLLKQGPAYPNAYQDQFYPNEYYTPTELNSGSRISVQSQGAPPAYSQAAPSVYSQGAPSVYSQSGIPPSYVEQPQSVSVSSYADSYATKKLGQSSSFSQKEVQVPASPAKGYQQRYAYAYSAAPAVYQSVAAIQPQQQQPQLVAYPVPVGSQIVGSQPGADGAYQPYGVHGFTRYAIKPTVVGSSEQTYFQGVHSAPASQFPAYKQQQQQAYSYAYQQPMSFYGYPLSQLHYSQGQIEPASQSSGLAPQSPPSPSGIQPRQDCDGPIKFCGDSSAIPMAVGPAPQPLGPAQQSPPSPSDSQPRQDCDGPIWACHGSPTMMSSSERSESKVEANKQQQQQQVNKPQQQQKRA